MNADKLHAKRINLIYNHSKSISKDKRKKFVKLALKLAYLDGKIDEFEKYFKKEKNNDKEKSNISKTK